MEPGDTAEGPGTDEIRLVELVVLVVSLDTRVDELDDGSTMLRFSGYPDYKLRYNTADYRI